VPIYCNQLEHQRQTLILLQSSGKKIVLCFIENFHGKFYMMDLRVLFIEDSEDDALLLLRELQKGGYHVQWERVQSTGDMQTALSQHPWDLILCDYSIPGMDVQQALEIVQKSGLDLPFIIATGTVEEETAVFALKTGAHDLLIKNNLARFLPAVQRELKEAEIRRERKLADVSLQASELRFRSTIENMMEGCQIIGHDWRYLYLNESAEKHNRRPNHELLGNIYMEMWPGIQETAVFGALKRCMEERSSHHMVNEFIYPDGAKGWFELHIQPIPDGIFILSSDITSRKYAEQALLEREMKMTMLLEMLPVGISILDAEHKISYINPALKKILKISEEVLLRGSYKDRIYVGADGVPISLDELASAQVRRENKEIHDFETGVVMEDGSTVWTNVSAVPVDFPDWNIVIVTSDISERKQAEMEILKLNSELEEKVAARTAELAQANERLHRLALFDELTGLYNRRGFLLFAEEQLLIAQHEQSDLLIFYGDLDRLKQVNDHFGHKAGDEAIIKAAHVLNGVFRSSDIKARLGGDEFIVLVAETSGFNVEGLLARLHEALASNGLSMSLGVVTFKAENETSISDLISRADEAMYIEKRGKSGRNAG
jgi:diguanylate cyclase (GGDEF)-like protein/PAS domain S-box-containing protein